MSFVLKTVFGLVQKPAWLVYDLVTGKSAKIEHESATLEIGPTSAFGIIGNAITMGFGNGYAYFTPDLDNAAPPSNPVIESLR